MDTHLSLARIDSYERVGISITYVRICNARPRLILKNLDRPGDEAITITLYFKMKFCSLEALKFKPLGILVLVARRTMASAGSSQASITTKVYRYPMDRWIFCLVFKCFHSQLSILLYDSS